MKIIFVQISAASITILRKKAFFAIFLALTPLIAFLLFMIPVKTIPGNDIPFQMQLFHTWDYILLTIVAALESLLVVMFVYQFYQRRLKKHAFATDGQSNIGLLSGVPAFLFGTKVCPLCIAGIFGFFGPGAVPFALQYRNWIFAASVAIIIFSLYSVSKKINGVCGSCNECEVRV